MGSEKDSDKVPVKEDFEIINSSWPNIQYWKYQNPKTFPKICQIRSNAKIIYIYI